MVEAWGGQVPNYFRFAIKASQRITHRKRLRNAEDEALRRHNCAWCLTDAADPSESISTADWGYIRFRDVDHTDARLS